MSQQTFAGLAYNTKKKVTRRERFLEEMTGVVPWKRLEAIVKPLYPKDGDGHPPIGVERMLRIYCMQQWCQLSDPGMEDALYDMESLRRFAKTRYRGIAKNTSQLFSLFALANLYLLKKDLRTAAV
jgi:IS5 family transposase